MLVRRRIQIRVAFAPTRFSAEHLRSVYETLVPLVERSIRAKSDDLVADSSKRGGLQQQEQQQHEQQEQQQQQQQRQEQRQQQRRRMR